jgi:tetratricopeptide (TPR) repeat protein
VVRSRIALCCALAFLFRPTLGFTRFAGNPSANLRGIVYSEATNQRIAHASVWLCDDGGNRMQESISTDSGEFAFMGLHAGSFILKVNAAGYDPVDIHVEVNFGTERGVSVFLKPSKASSTKIATGSSISAHELSMPEPARKLVDAGKKKLYGDKNPDGALQDFQAAVAKAPGYYEAYYQIGMAYLSLQNSPGAEKSLEKAVELSQQNDANADLALAVLLLARRDAARGEILLRRGLELNPNSWKGFWELGKLELYRNHLEPALEAAEKAKSLAPEQASVYRLLSLIHLRQKEYPSALADLDAYIRLDPDSSEGLTARKIRADTQQLMEKSQPAPVATSKPK